MPLITIGIVHYRKLEKLKKTVELIKRHTSHPYELHIFNNGYEDKEIRSYLKAISESGATVIRSHKNIGCSPARQRLFDSVKTKYCLSIDDDMYVCPGWDNHAVKILDEDPLIAAVGFPFCDANGVRHPGGKNIAIDNGVVRVIMAPQCYAGIQNVDDVPAGAMLYRSSLNDLIGWDPAFFIGFEDLDKGVRLKRSKYHCVVDCESEFLHDSISRDSRSGAYNDARRDYRRLRESYLHFVDKHGLRMDAKRHFFYAYVSLLPRPFLRRLAYLWLRMKDQRIRERGVTR